MKKEHGKDTDMNFDHVFEESNGSVDYLNQGDLDGPGQEVLFNTSDRPARANIAAVVGSSHDLSYCLTGVACIRESVSPIDQIVINEDANSFPLGGVLDRSVQSTLLRMISMRYFFF